MDIILSTGEVPIEIVDWFIFQSIIYRVVSGRDHRSTVDFDRILAACEEEININEATREYWTKLECDAETWCTFIRRRCVDMSDDEDVEKMLEKLNSFEQCLSPFNTTIHPVPILKALNFLALFNLKSDENESGLDYKALTKIIMACFAAGAADLERTELMNNLVVD